MYVLSTTDDDNSSTNCTNKENDDINIVVKYLFLSISNDRFFLSLIGLLNWTSNKLLTRV